jgi:hypothetical protein
MSQENALQPTVLAGAGGYRFRADVFAVANRQWREEPLRIRDPVNGRFCSSA